MLIVQHIRIEWTKTARGGELAECRSRIPKALPLPACPMVYDKQDHYFAQRLEFRECDAFAKPRERLSTPQIDIPYRTVNCTVEWKNGAPLVEYAYCSGAPTQVGRPASWDVPRDAWIRVEYNGRFSGMDDGNWYYLHEIINVAFAEMEQTDIFTALPPQSEFRRVSHLW